MKKTIFSRATALFLSVFILLSFTIVVTPTVAAEGESDPVIVLAGSDFQGKIWDETKNDGAGAYVFSHEESSANVKAIISAAKADGISSVDGFLFAGDYNYDSYGKNSAGIDALKSTVTGEYDTLNDGNMVLVQGNHEKEFDETRLSPSGANDTDDYGVFVIHEDDYAYNTSTAEAEETVKKTAASLKNYLEEKADANYSKPVFVVSHLPLNWNRRVIKDGGGVFAKYIFDVLNQYGESLNIIFMFGHNHSDSWDNYIGGDAVYLTKGDTIYIADPTEYTDIDLRKTASPTPYTLNFTYLNAGYVGESRSLNKVLTMTAFVIKDDIVEIRRYSKNGRYALKTQGAWSGSSTGTYGKDTDKIDASDDYLLTEYTGPDFIGNYASDGDVTVVSSDITKLEIAKGTTTPSDPDIYTAYTNYEITSQGYSDENFAYVKITLDQSFDLDAPIFARDTKTNKVTLCTVQNGKATFTTNSLSSYELYQALPVKGDVNFDSIVDIRDLVRLKKMLAGLENPDLEKWDGEVASSFAGGSGTETDPYLIENGGQLYKMVSGYSNVAYDSTTAEHTYFEIISDIDLNNQPWYRFATSSATDGSPTLGSVSNATVGFNGIIEGNGHTIYNLSRTESYTRATGLIPIATQGAEIHNLNLNGVEIKSGNSSNGYAAFIGGARGSSSGAPIVIENCSVTNASITATNTDGYAGGMVGYVKAQPLVIRNCFVTDCTVTTGTGKSDNPAGAFVTYEDGRLTIENSYCTGYSPVGKISDGNRDGAKYTNVYTNNNVIPEKIGDTTNITTLTDEQMKGEAAKDNMLGFDFENIWKVNDNNYPTFADLLAWDGTVASSFAGGKGTKDEPYLIENGGQLYKMVSEYSNVNVTLKTAEHTYFEITKDINLNNQQWFRFTNNDTTGTPSLDDVINAIVGFNGIIEGNGHTIYNLSRVDESGTRATGLIPMATQGAEIHNLNLKNGTISSSHSKNGYAALIGGAKGANASVPIIIENCSVTGFSVSTSNPAGYAGGFVGYAVSQSIKIKNSYISNSTITPGANNPAGAFICCAAGSSYMNSIIIENSYCIGTAPIGKLNDFAKDTTYTNVYTDVEGFDGTNGIKTLTTEQMQGENAKTNMAGFNYNTVWQTNTDGYPTFKNTSNADMNSDGKVDSLDLALLRNCLLQIR